jgi:hypothetical protein
VLAHPEKNFVQAKDSAGNLLSGFYISYVDTVPLDSAVLLDSAAHYAVTGDEVSVKFAGFYLQDNFLLDSNIDTIAQKYGWNTSDTTKYKVNWPYTFSENGENSGAIKAYSFAVQNIAPCSWVEFVFTSDYGYMEQGSQEIPQRPIYAYTPLRFKIYVAKITSNE